MHTPKEVYNCRNRQALVLVLLSTSERCVNGVTDSRRVGIVGLNQCGEAARRRLLADGHEVVAYDEHSPERTVAGLQGLLDGLPAGERIILVALPVDETVVRMLTPMLQRGDTIIHCERKPRRNIAYESALTVGGVRYVYMGVSVPSGTLDENAGWILTVGPLQLVEELEPLLTPILESLAGPGSIMWDR